MSNYKDNLLATREKLCKVYDKHYNEKKPEVYSKMAESIAAEINRIDKELRTIKTNN